MKNVIYLLLLITLACKQTPDETGKPKDKSESTAAEASEPRAPTKEEIKAYLKKEQDRVNANTVAEGEINRKITFLTRERDEIEGDINVKQIELNREQSRIFRKYSNEQVAEMTTSIRRGQDRISEIDKEVRALNKQMDRLLKEQ